MHIGNFASVAGMALSLVTGWASAQQTYRLTDLGTLGGNSSFGAAINDAGQVAGHSFVANNSDLHAFLWDGTTMLDLGTLGGPQSLAFAINAAGQVTGNADTANIGERHAFLWNGSMMQDLGTFGGKNSTGVAINSTGQVTGSASTPGEAEQFAYLWDGTTLRSLGGIGGEFSAGYAINDSGQITGEASTTTGQASHAFRWDGTTLQDLGAIGGVDYDSIGYAINASGQVVGSSNRSKTSRRAVVWDGATIQDLRTFGGKNSAGSAINDAGMATGSAELANDAGSHAFLWDGTVLRDLGTLGGANSYGTAINASGLIAGSSLTSGDAELHAFLWDGAAMQDLNSLVVATDPLRSFVVLSDVTDINNIGQVLAYGRDSRTGEFHAYVATPVDATPDVFSFTSQNDVAPGVPVTSNSATITGMDAPAPIAISGGQYSISCNGTFTADAATIIEGQSVCIRLTSSSEFNTPTTATLTIGGIQGSFSATTRAQGTGGGGGLGIVELLPLFLLMRRRRFCD